MKTLLKALMVLILLGCCLVTFGRQGTAKISGRYPLLNDGDIVTLTTNRLGDVSYGDSEEIQTCKITNHSFNFKVSCREEPLFFNLSIKEKSGGYQNLNTYKKLGLYGYYLEAGDNINLSTSNQNMQITGKGSAKFNVIKGLNSISKNFNRFWGIPEQAGLYFKSRDSLTMQSLTYLENVRKLLSPPLFDLLKSRIIGTWYLKAVDLEPLNDSMRHIAVKSLRTYKSNYDKAIRNASVFQHSSVLAYADVYTDGIIEQYKLDSCYLISKKFDTKSCYNYLLKNFSGIFRDRLLTTLLYDRRVESEDNSIYVLDALNHVKSDDFKNVLLQLKQSNMVGATAYQFSLADTLEKIHTLSEFKGKAVFIDFWFTGCGNCIAINPYMARIEKKFENKPVTFLSINLDKAKQTWIKSIRSGMYTTPFALNLFTGNLAFNHPISKFYNVTDGPTLIIIDKRGNIMLRPIDPRKDGGQNIEDLINKGIVN